MKEPFCRICKKKLIENDECLGLTYGQIKKESEFTADADDLPDIICMDCESIIYDAIDKAKKRKVK